METIALTDEEVVSLKESQHQIAAIESEIGPLTMAYDLAKAAIYQRRHAVGIASIAKVTAIVQRAHQDTAPAEGVWNFDSAARTLSQGK